MKKFLLLGLSTLLSSCVITPVNAANNLDYVTGRVKNVNDGYIVDADIYVGENKVSTSNDKGAFVAPLNGEEVIRISKAGYEDTLINVKELKSTELGEVSLDYPFNYCGETKFKSSPLYNDWTGYNTRTLDGIRFKFESPYNRFQGSTSELSLYIDTKDVTSTLQEGDYMFKLRGDGKLFVYDYGFVHNEIYPSTFNYQIDVKDDKTEVTLEVPYEFLGINETDIVGIIFNDYIKVKDLMCDYVFDEVMITYKETKNFTRINKKGFAFGNNVNDYNELWMSRSTKERLIENYRVLMPKGLNENSDEIYMGYEYKETSLDLSFTGFGYFEEDEYIKMVIHTSETYKNGWLLSSDDTMLRISREGVRIYYGAPEFFAPENANYPASFASSTTYIDYGNYFTINVNLDWEFVTGWKDKTQGFKFALAEFGDDTLYSPLGFEEYMYLDNTKTGDIAAYNGYISVKSPFDVITINEQDKDTLTEGYAISFANPKDTSIEEADDMYVKATKDSENLTLDFIGFGHFQDYETVKFVLHDTLSTDGKAWAIDKNDASVIFNKNKCIIRTNSTNFFDLNLIISSGTQCRNNPIYNRYEHYFTFKITLPLDQLGSIASAASVDATFLEMDYIGIVYNGGEIISAVRYNGAGTGDPAMQSSYVNLY